MSREKRADMRDAGGALAWTCAGERRALYKFEFVEAPRIHGLEIVNGHAGAGTDDTSDRARRQVRRATHIPNAADVHSASHAQERISRCETKAERDGVAGVP